MITGTLLSGNVKSLSVSQVEQALKNTPSAETAHEARSIIKFLVKTRTKPSKHQTREDVKNGAIYVSGERQNGISFTVEPDDGLDGEYVIIHKGKRKYTLVEIK